MDEVRNGRPAEELGVHERDMQQFEELRAKYPDTDPRAIAASLARNRKRKQPITRELLVLEVATLNQWGSPLVLWQCLPLSEELVWGDSGAVRYPARIEIRCHLQALDWTDDDFLTILVRAVDPDFAPQRGYPDERGAQSLDVMREAVLGRSLNVTTSQAVVVSVGPSERSRMTGDEFDEVRSRWYQDTQAVYWDPGQLPRLRDEGFLD